MSVETSLENKSYHHLSATASVFATCDIPEGTCSSPGVGCIDVRRLLEKFITQIYLQAELIGGFLSLSDKHLGPKWAHYLVVARNCHQQNVELTLSHRGFILRTTKPIQANDELFVWFGSDVVSTLEFPFLKPDNIKGHQAYHCHKCGKLFQDPNPLKVHLSFQCHSDSPEKVDGKTGNNCLAVISLYQSLNFNSPVDHNFSFKDCHLMSSAHQLESIMPSSSNEHLHQTLCRTHAVSQEINSSSSVRTSAFKRPCYESPKDDAIKVKPLNVSGHVCVYCGKAYSRKYGLKIHVRTHTGYKPLKCRYCFRPFSDPSNLNKHVRLHIETEMSYRCKLCSKVFVRRRDLERHLHSRHVQINTK